MRLGRGGRLTSGVANVLVRRRRDNVTGFTKRERRRDVGRERQLVSFPLHSSPFLRSYVHTYVHTYRRTLLPPTSELEQASGRQRKTASCKSEGTCSILRLESQRPSRRRPIRPRSGLRAVCRYRSQCTISVIESAGRTALLGAIGSR